MLEIWRDCENAYGRYRWCLAWTPFGPVLLTDEDFGWTPDPTNVGVTKL